MSAATRNLTLEEIGARAGVSRSTVSRVLNDHPDVRPEVRARVEAVIAATGYQPNVAARALVSKRSGMIGLVMLTEIDELFGDPYYSALVNGIQHGCAEHDLIFAIFPTYSADGRSDALTPQIAQHFVDGVIVTSVPQSASLIASLYQRRTRMVVIGPTAHGETVTRVDVDNVGGGAAAVAHLVAAGRQRIGFVGPTVEHLFGADRLAGFRRGLAATGVRSKQAVEQLVALDRPTVDGGAAATTALLQRSPDVDALFVATDTMAEGVYRALRTLGRTIPGDVAVVGFDGLPGGPQLDPVLTTVVQPVDEIGRNAVRLLATDSDADDPEVVVLPVAVRVGGSCGTTQSARSGPS